MVDEPPCAEPHAGWCGEGELKTRLYPIMNTLQADYEIGGGWGCHVSWQNPDQFSDINEDSVFDVYGHHPRIPQPGQTVVGEFQNSFIKFEFLEVDRQSNPSDMFFGKVKPVEQVMKGS